MQISLSNASTPQSKKTNKKVKSPGGLVALDEGSIIPKYDPEIITFKKTIFVRTLEEEHKTNGTKKGTTSKVCVA